MSSGALWAGIVCPQLSLQALLSLLPEGETVRRPLAVHEQQRGRSLVLEVNRAAHALGVRPGQRLAGALAVAPALESLARDRRAEAQLLEEIATIAYRYSHQVAIGSDGVVLEVAGSQRLHGRFEQLLEAMRSDLAGLGPVLRYGSAPTAAAAALLARGQVHAPDPKTLDARLRDWPLTRMMLPAAELQRLQGLGLVRLGEALELPRFEFERRLGRDLLQHLDRLRGRAPAPLKYWQPPERFRQRLELPVPTHRSEALLFALNRILRRLERWLQVRDRALTGLSVRLQPEERDRSVELRVGLNRPGFRREHLLELLRLKLEPLRLEADIAALCVRADSTASYRPPQGNLWQAASAGEAWDGLLDRLRARVGEDKLRGIAACPDHRPEKAWCWSEPGRAQATGGFPERPGWLLPEPRPCRAEDLRLIEGPERIETGWWDGQDCRRDYWIAHDRHGNRLWVFREYKPCDGWFVHGLFG